MTLLSRFTQYGTLTDPQGIPDPSFALEGTLNWMRALAILSEASKISPSSVRKSCRSNKVTKNANLTPQAQNTVFEQLLMSLHHLASLEAMKSTPNRIDTSRSAIVTWYYGIFHAASAMIAAQDGSQQENHADTAKAWDRQFMDRAYVPKPFGYRVTTLVKKDMEDEIEALRAGNVCDLNSEPVNETQAFGACMSYLKGSANWRREYIEDEVRKRDLAEIKLDNFRSKVAKALRDKRLKGKTFGFVHQAFRYRGKANYREALFISYGKHVEYALGHFHGDMFKVLKDFLCFAGSFCAVRLGDELWNEFMEDLAANVVMCVKHTDVWDKA